jgi:hypothetical protein
MQNAATPTAEPTAIRQLEVELKRFFDMRVEDLSDDKIFLIDFSDTSNRNRRVYVWDINEEVLIDTGEDIVLGSLVAPEDGRYMIFLHDESLSGRDLDGDGIRTNNILRMYHLGSGQKINFQLPARSATPASGETRSQFEYHLNENNVLTYSVSSNTLNNQQEKYAPWNMIDLLDIIYEIEGTPTPTPTFTPSIPTNTPTLPPGVTPSPTPTHTPIPTIPPDLANKADINQDGIVDHLDMLLFQYFWLQESEL